MDLDLLLYKIIFDLSYYNCVEKDYFVNIEFYIKKVIWSIC